MFVRNTGRRLLESKAVHLTTRRTSARGAVRVPRSAPGAMERGGCSAAAVCLSRARVAASLHPRLSARVAIPGSSGCALAACIGQWLLFSKFELKDIYWFLVSYVFLFFFFLIGWRARSSKGKSVTFLSCSWKPERLPICRQICKELNVSALIWSCKQDLNAALALWLLFWLLLSIIHYLLHVTHQLNHMHYFCYALACEWAYLKLVYEKSPLEMWVKRNPFYKCW